MISRSEVAIKKGVICKGRMDLVDRGVIWTVNICKNSERRWHGAIFPGGTPWEWMKKEVPMRQRDYELKEMCEIFWTLPVQSRPPVFVNLNSSTNDLFGQFIFNHNKLVHLRLQ